MTRALSVLFIKVVKTVFILLNMRVLNIIHKHLLKENNYNNQTIEIRSRCIIQIICTLFINKRTHLFTPCRIFCFLLCIFCECVFIKGLHKNVVVEIRHVWLKHETYQHNNVVKYVHTIVLSAAW